MTYERQLRREIVQYGRMMYEHGFVAGMDGNISARLDDERILCTPTAMCKGAMRPTDMVIVDMEGRRVAGKRDVSSEIGMHLLIYRERSDVRSVVHAHPTTATGFAAAGVALDKPLVSEVVLSLGSIPLARYGTPGTPELAEALEPFVSEYDAILMANHGVVAYGESLPLAYMKMETVEHFARIALVTQILGRQEPLGNEDVEKLLVVRSLYQGTKSVAPRPIGMFEDPTPRRTSSRER